MFGAIQSFFNTFLYEPLYNALVLFIDIIPSADVGLAIILLTLIVRTALLPMSLKMTRTQLAVKAIEPRVKEIREEYKDNREEQARKMMDLYKENKINPFSGFFFLIVQFAIIIPLYFIFTRGGLPDIDPTRLYSFIPIPETVNTLFLGVIDVAGKSLILALIVGVLQYIQSHLLVSSMQKNKEKEDAKKEAAGDAEGDKKEGEIDFKAEFAKGLQMQMKYVFPIFITFIAYTTSGAVALYFAVGSLVTIGQELFLKPKIMREYEDA